jgi:RsmE family RNA methyltransferase
MAGDRHEFAFFYKALPQMMKNRTVIIYDKELTMRICRILRLSTGDCITVFDNEHIVDGCIIECTQQQVVLEIQAHEQLKPLIPEITVLLPVLKRDALEQAVYSIVELGGSAIQLLETDKIQRQWVGDKELDRLQRIAIAAAEQSKNFLVPEIFSPVTLEGWLQDNPGKTIHFFDVDGKPAYEVFLHKTVSSSQHLYLLFGPEGDLSSSEKELLVKHNAVFCRLTPTVLRSFQAVTVGLGFVRSQG